MKSLVGYTGFVGSNIAMHCNFDYYYDSKNIKESYGTNPDLLVYSGVPAQKFMANKFPEKDMEIIKNAIENIKMINPKKVVLISTIDVYDSPVDVDENTIISIKKNEPYGYNRYILEKWVMNNFDDYLIVRLPALYGRNIKKNFIYDLINIIPSMLKMEKFNELCDKNDFIKDYYENLNNGFYGLKQINNDERNKLKEYFNNIGFSSLNFTDSRGSFQFYNLSNLWDHICIALKNNIKILNLATEPVKVSEIYKYVIGMDFSNECSNTIPKYNYKTIHSSLFGGNDGYLFNKEFILKDIKEFVESELGFKLSISNIAWNEEDDEAMYSYIFDLGFKGLEIAPTRVIKENPYDNLDKIKNFANEIKRKYGLVIPSIQSIWYGRSENMFNSEEERIKLIEYTKKAIDFASAVNCKNLVFGCPKNRSFKSDISNAEIKKISIEFFREIGKYAKSKNTVFAIEANPTIYNTNFINTTLEALNLVKEIDMDSIKVNLDLGTMISNGEDINQLIDNMHYINHIHISEPYLSKIEQRKLHSDLIKILKDSKYSNFISIEMKNSNNLEGTKETIGYVRRLFK